MKFAQQKINLCFFRDQEVISSLINQKGIKHLVEMLLSRHTLMQNEALLSLSIITATQLTDQTEVQLSEADIGDKLWTFLENNRGHLELPVLANLLTLMEQLLKSGKQNSMKMKWNRNE